MTDNPGGSSESRKGSDDPFDIVLDEDFVKGAKAKEPSARSRELGARWAKEPPQQTGWRNDSPDPWADAAPTRRKKRVWPRNLAVALVAAGVVGYLVYPRHHAATPLNASPAGTGKPWAGSPTPSPSFTNPDDQYFVGSPALSWADNEGGIVAPAATAIGSFSAAEITSGYADLGKLLAAGNLDATILDGGPVTDFTGLIDPREQVVSQLTAWLAHPAYQTNPTSLVTRFNPATTRLLGHTVKVSGTMSASVVTGNILTVTGDYTFVYAVGPADGASGTPSRAVVHRVYQLELNSPGITPTQAGKVWIYKFGSDISNSACNTYNGYINPEFGNGSVPGSGKTIDPYASTNLLDSSTPAAPGATSSGTPECDTVSRI